MIEIISQSIFMQEQKVVCEKFNSPAFFCGREEMLGLAIESLGQSPIYGLRRRPSPVTTGWFIWAGNFSNDDSFFSPVHIAHVVKIPPVVERYLALSPGFRFILDQSGYEDVWYEQA